MIHKDRKSPRLRHWDYGSSSAYFITICTKDREHYFGEISNSKMQVSPVGAIAHVLWHEIKNHAKNVELGEFVVMPNHVHGILILNGNKGIANIDGGDVGDGDVGDGRDVDGRDVACNVPTETETETETGTETGTESIPINHLKNEQMAAISPKSNTVSSIIRSYKSAVTKYCNRLGLPFKWQSRYHDHIIRNDGSFQRISKYIMNNPLNWREDKFY